MLNPEPVTFAPEIVTLPPPELLRISVSVCELPTWTLLKLRLVGLAPNSPELTAVPDIVTVTELEILKLAVFFPLDWVVNAIETVPLSVPLEVGENVIQHVTLCPPASVKG
jgi:hypothetical protein